MSVRRAQGGGLAAAFVVMLVTGAVQAAPAAGAEPDAVPTAQPSVQPEAVSSAADGEGDPGAGLPEGLVQALSRDLGQTPDEYLAGADAAAKASDILPELQQAGIAPDDVWLDDTTINVRAVTPEQQTVAADLGATPTTAEPPSAPDLSAPTAPYEDLINGTGWTQNGILCSTGFNGRTGSGPFTVATAGHCLLADGPAPAGTINAYKVNQSAANQTGTKGSLIGPLDKASFAYGGGNDGGLIQATNSALKPLPRTSTWNGGTIAVRGMITATVGASICKSGRTTGWTCGKVLEVNYPQQIEGDTGTVTVNSVATSMCMFHGDSGGAAMIGGYAVGINSSGAWKTIDCNNSGGYSAIYPLQGSTQSFTSTHPGWRPVTLPSDRVFGADRVDTSVAVSKRAFPTNGSADVVYIANGWNFPDALVTGPAATTQNGPVLLAPLAAGLPKSVSDEIGRLTPKKIVIAGGTSAISAQTEAQLKATFPSVTVKRLAGADRFATARAIVADVYKAPVKKLYVASGIGFPDSLSASAAGAADGSPVLTVAGNGGALDAATMQAVQRVQPASITVVGGPVSVSNGILAQLKRYQPSTDRVGGATRWETSQLLAKRIAATDKTKVLLANGVGFPDALSGSVLAGKAKRPLLITQQGCVDSGALRAMSDWKTASVTLIGGTASLSAAVADLRSC